MRLVAAAALALIGLMSQAQAKLMVDYAVYNGALPETYAPKESSYTDLYEYNVTGSVGGLRTSPFDGSQYSGRSYDAVERGSATYSVSAFGMSDGTLGTFAIVLGSPDSYNKITFSLGGHEVDTYSASGSGSGYEFLKFSGIGQYDSITIQSDRAAAEFAAVAMSAVPLPPALPMFGGGLLVMAVVGFRIKRRAHVAVSMVPC